MIKKVCKYCENSICINEKSPSNQEKCPVNNMPGLCKYEELIDVKDYKTPKECFIAAVETCEIDLSNDEITTLFNSLMRFMQDNHYCFADDRLYDEDIVFKAGQIVYLSEILQSKQWVYDKRTNDNDNNVLIFKHRDDDLYVVFNNDNFGKISINETTTTIPRYW